MPLQTLIHVVEPQSEAFDFALPADHVKVSTPPTSFYVNSYTLSSRSEFFRAALKKPWLRWERQQKVITLPELSPAIFNIYLNWIFTRRIPIGLNHDEDPKESSTWPLMIQAYAMGDFLLDADFKDAITDAMALTTMPDAQGKWHFPHQNFRKLLYESTAPGAKARKLLVYSLRRSRYTPDDLEHPDLAKEMAEAKRETSLQQLSGSNVLRLNATWVAAQECLFHEHPPQSRNCYRMRTLPAKLLCEKGRPEFYVKCENDDRKGLGTVGSVRDVELLAIAVPRT